MENEKVEEQKVEVPKTEIPRTRQLVIETDGNNVRIVKSELSALEIRETCRIILDSLMRAR